MYKAALCRARLRRAEPPFAASGDHGARHDAVVPYTNHGGAANR